MSDTDGGVGAGGGGELTKVLVCDVADDEDGQGSGGQGRGPASRHPRRQHRDHRHPQVTQDSFTAFMRMWRGPVDRTDPGTLPLLNCHLRSSQPEDGAVVYLNGALQGYCGACNVGRQVSKAILRNARCLVMQSNSMNRCRDTSELGITGSAICPL